MLEIVGKRFSCCDGISRRSMLRVGALGIGGLTLPQLLAHRSKAAQAGKALPRRSVIFVELAGGPTHFETYDPKPQAPSEYRGPLGVVDTALPGVQFSELMIHQAKLADKLAVIRSMHHDSSSHSTSSHLTQTGYYLRNRQNRSNEMPCIGSVTARLQGAHGEGVPAYVGLQRTMRYGNAAYLGKAFNPFTVTGDPNKQNFKVDNLALVRGLDADRVNDRRYLLEQIGEQHRVIDLNGVSEAIGKFSLEAFDVVTSGKTQQAFSIESEPAQIRDAYGRNRTGQEFLLARRLIESGVSFVSLRVGSWDDHSQIARRMKDKGPAYDQAMGALISDLYERGMDRKVWSWRWANSVGRPKSTRVPVGIIGDAS